MPRDTSSPPTGIFLGFLPRVVGSSEDVIFNGRAVAVIHLDLFSPLDTEAVHTYFLFYGTVTVLVHRPWSFTVLPEARCVRLAVRLGPRPPSPGTAPVCVPATRGRVSP